MTNLRNTLLVLPPEQRRPGDPTRVLSLEEKAFGLAILESEDFAVTTDVKLALYFKKDFVSACPISDPLSFYLPISSSCRSIAEGLYGGDMEVATHLARVYLLAAEGIVVGTHFGGGDAVPVLVLSGVVVDGDFEKARCCFVCR